MQFDRFTVVLLVRPPDAPDLTEEEALVDQDDQRLRGISVMSVDAETARRLYAADPAVLAGRLAVQVMTWMVPAGNVRFEHVQHPRSTAEADED